VYMHVTRACMDNICVLYRMVCAYVLYLGCKYAEAV
jgi:hypothetical protein